MADNRTELSTYESRYGGGYISVGQYLAELLVERQASKDGKTLPLKFWNDKVWKSKFLAQVRMAAKLLKDYSPTAIMRALRTPRGKQAFSLGAPFVRGLINEQQKELDLSGAEEPEEDDNSLRGREYPPVSVGCSPLTPRVGYVYAPSLLSKLKGL